MILNLSNRRRKKKRNNVIEIGSPDFEAYQILRPSKTEKINLREAQTNCYTAAVNIAANYHLPVMLLLQQLESLYPKGDIPSEDIPDLMQQVQGQTADYEEKVEKVHEVLALIRDLDDQGNAVFPEDSEGRRVHVLRFSEDTFFKMDEDGRIVAGKQGIKVGKRKITHTTVHAKHVPDKKGLSYHYMPYCFDSKSEGDFFGRIITTLGENPEDIKAFVFTGLANTRLTDFWFYYKGEDGAFYRYFPDFLLLKNSGEFYIVEIKGAHERGNVAVEAKAKAVQILADMPENRFRYVIIYVNGDDMETDPGMIDVREWIEKKATKEKRREQKES